MPKADDQTTKDRILTAAIEELAEVGWDGSRTRSIAERAGVNNALVHYHFSSVEDLLLDAVASIFSQFAETMAASLAAETISKGMSGMLDMIAAIDPTESSWKVLMEAIMQTSRVPRLAEWTIDLLDGYRTAMRRRLDAAVASDELPQGTDTEGLALGLMALLDGLGLYAFVNPGYDTRRAGKAIVTLLTNEGPTI